jgi:hypothetical protein
LLPWYDADALERLLRLALPESRARYLNSFLVPDEPGQQRPLLVQVGHPALQAILEEVWVPFWDSYTEEGMDSYADYFPGRELAKHRRRAKGSVDAPSDEPLE